MGVAERREREKEQRRNDIIDAAEKIFFAKGINAATMDEVAEEAELSKGTLYLYFNSKEELYLAINARGLLILQKVFTEAIKKAAKGIDKLRQIWEAYFKYYEDYPDYFDAMVYYDLNEIKLDKEGTCAGECRDQGLQVLDTVATAIGTGIKDGSFRKELNPMNAAMVLWAHTTGVIQILSRKGKHLEEEHGISLQDMIDLSWVMVKRLVAN